MRFVVCCSCCTAPRRRLCRRSLSWPSSSPRFGVFIVIVGGDDDLVFFFFSLVPLVVRPRSLDGAAGEGRRCQRVPLADAGTTEAVDSEQDFARRSSAFAFLSFFPPLIRPRVASLSLSLSSHPLSRPPLRPNENHHYLHHHPRLHLLPHLHRSERAASSPSPRRRRGSSSGRTRGGSSSTCAHRPRSRGPPSGVRCARRSTSPRRSTRCRT